MPENGVYVGWNEGLKPVFLVMWMVNCWLSWKRGSFWKPGVSSKHLVTYLTNLTGIIAVAYEAPDADSVQPIPYVAWLGFWQQFCMFDFFFSFSFLFPFTLVLLQVWPKTSQLILKGLLRWLGGGYHVHVVTIKDRFHESFWLQVII